MKTPFKILTLVLVAVFAVSACAPASPPASIATEVPSASTETAIATTVAPTAVPSVGATALPPTLTPTVQAIPTSRGPNLEATDPTTVSLASGGLQLVEFFRFT